MILRVPQCGFLTLPAYPRQLYSKYNNNSSGISEHIYMQS